jgi:[ribosomal protein S5]-alanine N-acetyltransferase
MIVLETVRLLFRDHEPADLEPYCEMEADPEVRRYFGPPRAREAAERKFRDVYLPPVTNRMALWATVFKPEGRYIGYCGIYPHFGPGEVAIAGEGVLAFYLARAYWGRGLATEAGRAFIAFGFGELGLTRIVAGADVENAASHRVLEKLGFVWLRTEAGGKRSYHNYELRTRSMT